MTIKVYSTRTLIVPGFSGITLNAGIHSCNPEVEDYFVKAGFAEFVQKCSVKKSHSTPENKMLQANEDKDLVSKVKYKKSKSRKKISEKVKETDDLNVDTKE